MARLTVREVSVWGSGHPLVLVFAKSARDAGSVYRGGEKRRGG